MLVCWLELELECYWSRSHRLKEEVIFLETNTERFQLSLSKQREKSVEIFQKYTWAKVKNARDMDTAAMIKGEWGLVWRVEEVAFKARRMLGFRYAVWEIVLTWYYF